jgi:hypothetical protein
LSCFGVNQYNPWFCWLFRTGFFRKVEVFADRARQFLPLREIFAGWKTARGNLRRDALT